MCNQSLSYTTMRKSSSVFYLSLALLALTATVAPAQKKSNKIYTKPYITGVMEKVADWQLANPVAINVRNENDWARAAFYTGVMATYRTTQSQKYLDAATTWSQSFNWKLADRWRHADDHAK